MLKPSGISHTVYPDQLAKDFNEFMAHNAKTTIAAVVDDYKERFDALWLAYKRDIQRNSDPKLSNGTCPKCQMAEFNSTIQRSTPAYHV
jgi:hypothetical protein